MRWKAESRYRSRRRMPKGRMKRGQVWCAKRPRHLSRLRLTEADHQIHQRLEAKGCSQDCKQNVRSLVDTPANLEKSDQEGLQARRREEVLIDIRLAAWVAVGRTAARGPSS